MQIAVHGGRRAEGEVVLQGSKNAALPMLAASILTSDEMIFRHCPGHFRCQSDGRTFGKSWFADGMGRFGFPRAGRCVKT